MSRRRATVLLGAAGLALLAVGAVRVVATSSGASIVTLIVVGALLLVSPFVIARLERLSVGNADLELQLTREIAALGAPKAAQILDHTDLGRLADSYTLVHAELADPGYEDARMHLADLLADRAAALARQEKFEASEVRMLFASAGLATRVLAIGLMKGDPALADGATILAAIADPRSKSEQHQGLELAKLCWHQLPASYRSAIRSVVAGSPDFAPGSNRRRLADEVLALAVS